MLYQPSWILHMTTHATVAFELLASPCTEVWNATQLIKDLIQEKKEQASNWHLSNSHHWHLSNAHHHLQLLSQPPALHHVLWRHPVPCERPLWLPPVVVVVVVVVAAEEEKLYNTGPGKRRKKYCRFMILHKRCATISCTGTVLTRAGDG